MDADPDRQELEADPDPPNDANPTRSGSTTLMGSLSSIANYYRYTAVQIKLKDLVNAKFLNFLYVFMQGGLVF
jgi:hypothetical protein